jgi:hypothetical protein
MKRSIRVPDWLKARRMGGAGGSGLLPAAAQEAGGSSSGFRPAACSSTSLTIARRISASLILWKARNSRSVSRSSFLWSTITSPSPMEEIRQIARIVLVKLRGIRLNVKVAGRKTTEIYACLAPRARFAETLSPHQAASPHGASWSDARTASMWTRPPLWFPSSRNLSILGCLWMRG